MGMSENRGVAKMAIGEKQRHQHASTIKSGVAFRHLSSHGARNKHRSVYENNHLGKLEQFTDLNSFTNLCS